MRIIKSAMSDCNNFHKINLVKSQKKKNYFNIVAFCHGRKKEKKKSFPQFKSQHV